MLSLRQGLRLVVAVLTYAATTSAQQFANAPFDLDYPGFSSSCHEAMNTAIDCPVALQIAAEKQPFFQKAQLNSICTTQCKASLEAVKGFIRANCSTESDVIKKGTSTYPATYVVDKFLHAYNKTCMRDPQTGEFCDVLLPAWLSKDSWKPEYDCHECVYGLKIMELESPFGWNVALESRFNASAATCQLNGTEAYVIQRPKRYKLNNSTRIPNVQSKAPVLERNCTTPYKLQEGDNCTSIAQAQNVSSIGLIIQNRLNAYCSDIAALGNTICLPERCKSYVVRQNQTCWDVMMQTRGMSVRQLKEWNPRLNAGCTNMHDLAGDVICLSAPGEPLPIHTMVPQAKV